MNTPLKCAYIVLTKALKFIKFKKFKKKDKRRDAPLFAWITP
nr:hypothetical protein [uncultured Campylobacter sp.]